jgi:hypothetical protein
MRKSMGAAKQVKTQMVADEPNKTGRAFIVSRPETADLIA